jgi:hypothetical protein
MVFIGVHDAIIDIGTPRASGILITVAVFLLWVYIQRIQRTLVVSKREC